MLLYQTLSSTIHGKLFRSSISTYSNSSNIVVQVVILLTMIINEI